MPPTAHAALTSFIGRSEELAKLGSLLDNFRLVVVLGPGGIGKTRVARELLQLRAENSVFVDLADADDVSAVNRAVVAALGLSPESASDVPELLASCGSVLLVLDNFEQLVEVAASDVHGWLQSAPDLRVLVTSRRRLELGGEVSFELPPLRHAADTDGSEALDLFIERASRQRPELDWSDADLRGFANEIVIRLDGIPLALELAAAQLHLLEPQELLGRLDGLLSALGRGPRTAADRHRTVRCAIQGSWDVLGSAGQRALSMCSVFRGGFSLDAAEAVLAELGDSLELVTELRNRSLLRSGPVAGVSRLGLYETVRAFASEELSAEDSDVAHRKLAQWCVRQPPVSSGAMSRQLIQRASLERDNLAAAFDWATASGEGQLSADVGIRLAAMYTLQGPAGAALEAMTRALVAAAAADLPAETLADLHCRRGRLEVHYGELSAAREDWKAAGLAVSAVSNGLGGELAALRAGIDRASGDGVAAESAYREALDHLREHRPDQVGRTLSNFAGFLMEQGCVGEARRAFGEALEALRVAGDLRMEAVTLGNLGLVEHEDGDLVAARVRFERALELHTELGYRRFVGITRCDLAVLAFEEGRLDAADALFGDGCEELRAAGDFRQLALATMAHAACVARLGDRARSLAIAEEAAKHRAKTAGTALGEAVSAYAMHRELAGAPAHSDTQGRARSYLSQSASSSANNDELRLALRLLQQALEEIDTASAALRVAAGSVELTLPGGARVSLRSRPVLARILEALVSARIRDTEPVAVGELVRAGWPDQRAVNSSAVNRLHVALSTLRKAGLRPYLLRSGDGYVLAPDLTVLRERSVDPE